MLTCVVVAGSFHSAGVLLRLEVGHQRSFAASAGSRRGRNGTLRTAVEVHWLLRLLLLLLLLRLLLLWHHMELMRSTLQHLLKLLLLLEVQVLLAVGPGDGLVVLPLGVYHQEGQGVRGNLGHLWQLVLDGAVDEKGF